MTKEDEVSEEEYPPLEIGRMPTAAKLDQIMEESYGHLRGTPLYEILIGKGASSRTFRSGEVVGHYVGISNDQISPLLADPSVSTVILDGSKWIGETIQIALQAISMGKRVLASYGTHQDIGAAEKFRYLETAGVISLGAIQNHVGDLALELNTLFEGVLDGAIDALVGRHYIPPMSGDEISAAVNAVETGGILDIPDFMYLSSDAFQGIKNSPKYATMDGTTIQVQKDMLPFEVELVMGNQLERIVSLGPSPDIDKLLLLQLAKLGQRVRYFPVDVNRGTIKQTNRQIAEFLTDQMGGRWQMYVSLEDMPPMRFGEVSPQDNVLVLMRGNTINNSQTMLDTILGMCSQNSYASFDTTISGSNRHHSALWKAIYDNGIEKQVFSNAGRALIEGLARRESDWEVTIEYKHDPNGESRMCAPLKARVPIQGVIHKNNVTVTPGVEPELGISNKYTEGAWKGHFDRRGVRVVAEAKRQIPLDIDGLKGYAYAVILEPKRTGQ